MCYHYNKYEKGGINMTVRLLIVPVLLIAAVIVVVYAVIIYLKSNSNSTKNDKLEFNDLTNDSLLKQVNDNLTVIKYCMIFFVVVTIFAIAGALIFYIVHLLS